MAGFVATTSTHLGPISDLIHDAWFPPGDFVRDFISREIVLPFKWEARAWGEQSELDLLRETWRYNEYRVALRPAPGPSGRAAFKVRRENEHVMGVTPRSTSDAAFAGSFLSRR